MLVTQPQVEQPQVIQQPEMPQVSRSPTSPLTIHLPFLYPPPPQVTSTLYTWPTSPSLRTLRILHPEFRSVLPRGSHLLLKVYSLTFTLLYIVTGWAGSGGTGASWSGTRSDCHSSHSLSGKLCHTSADYRIIPYPNCWHSPVSSIISFFQWLRCRTDRLRLYWQQAVIWVVCLLTYWLLKRQNKWIM